MSTMEVDARTSPAMPTTRQTRSRSLPIAGASSPKQKRNPSDDMKVDTATLGSKTEIESPVPGSASRSPDQLTCLSDLGERQVVGSAGVSEVKTEAASIDGKCPAESGAVPLPDGLSNVNVRRTRTRCIRQPNKFHEPPATKARMNALPRSSDASSAIAGPEQPPSASGDRKRGIEATNPSNKPQRNNKQRQLSQPSKCSEATNQRQFMKKDILGSLKCRSPPVSYKQLDATTIEGYRRAALADRCSCLTPKCEHNDPECIAYLKRERLRICKEGLSPDVCPCLF
eukprot:GHVN01096730.1.p1 GENE.GHVN01096730.1~~GHVN01096730.1.p1  ORF type:complete len:285 (-),score=17.80 GHVN01096730.1:506-1360(-)